MTESQRRSVPRLEAEELETALAFLDFQREALLIKCAGLPDADLRRAVVPTGTTLLWLVRHNSVGERYWFWHTVAGLQSGAEWDFDSHPPADEPAADVLAEYEQTWRRSNELVRGIGDPSALTPGTVDGRRLPLRWVLWHMGMETARHAGHADILREQIDGATGR